MNSFFAGWFYVYVLKSDKNGAIYIGCTSDLKKRIQKHREGKTFSVKKLLPVKLIYFEAYRTKKEAFEREKRLKHYGSALRSLKLRIPISLVDEKG